MEFVVKTRGFVSQIEFAKRISLSPPTLRAYESGDLIPPLDKLDRIARMANKKVVITFEDL
jgi:transcriptional regulator with XRE-family HTH domain